MAARFITAVIVGLFLLGLLLTGVLGTETRLLFYWPACVALGLAAVGASLRWRWRLKFAPADVCLASVLVLAAYFVGRQLTSPVVTHAREDLFILLGCLVTYTLSATVLSHPGARLWVLGVLLLTTLGNLVVGFIHFSGRWSFHVVPSYMRAFGDEHRIGGFYNNPNHLAAFLTMMSLVLAGMALFGRGGAARKLLLGFVALSAAIGVALTVSRGALVGLAAGGVVLAALSLFILWKTYPHLVGKLLVATAVVLAMGGMVLFGVFSEQLQRRFGMSAFSEGEPRMQIWKAALEQHQTHPLIGAGARMFYEGCVTYRQAIAPLWLQEAEFVHNEWLQTLADYGWVGLVLLLAVLGIHLRNAAGFLRWFVTDKFDRTATLMSNGLGLAVGAAAAIVATMAHAGFEFHFHVAAPALLAAYLLGVLANPGFSPVGQKPLRVPGCRPLLKFALLAAGAVMLFGSWKYGRAEFYAEKASLLEKDKSPEVTMERLDWLTRAADLDPENGDYWYQRGLVRLETAAGQPETLAKSLLKRGAEDLDRAHRLNPYSMYPSLALADAYDALDEPTRAVQAIDDALRVAPLYEMPRLAYALHLHRQQRWAEAEEAYFWADQAAAGRTGEAHPFYLRMLKDAAAAP
ncbi:O-antigen ligase family protein [Verrucomicrobium sp. BvORR034]|uniref:O-antigen ligase family protein n=1 Tax=Verrucomicrobium sp. BvORR034 TaxID=1396418 RepID=UPI0006798320|nr:O-antigen ligase family protein [Verrucomicrobium sp. BvORR034]